MDIKPVASNQLGGVNPDNTNKPALTDASGDVAAIWNFFQPIKPEPRGLKVSLNDKDNIVVDTKDGYQLTFSGHSQEWTIRQPDGAVTRIWGDPHVVESDGDQWDFHVQSTFTFGENKVTVEVAPWKNTAATVSATVTIYNGSDRVTIRNVDKDLPIIEAWSQDAKSHDAKIDDGDVYRLYRGPNGQEEWHKQ